MTAEAAAREEARAKGTLFLHSTGRRAEGDHQLYSLAVFPACGDRLTARPAKGLSLEMDGPFAAGLESG
ncbi:MAG: 4-(cytidine 5'-diphospho)-2-C-methyl-D-erythritol kinase, partial [Pikeienuella sp.]